MRSQMFSQLFFILLLSICSKMNDVAAANSSKCLQDQKILLLQLRNNLTYDSEISTKLVKWNQRIDCCQWQGVTCNGAGQVIGLDLSSESFSGSINPLANLKFLSVIRLDGNNLSAPIPEFFADFTNLTVLSLSYCNLIEVPQKIFQVPTLQTIDLSANDMLGGSLPEFPSNGSLQTLVLSGTKFSGSLPESIGNLRKLTHIELKACNFTGRIPTSMENLTQLVHLDLDWNSFTGSFPYFKLSKNLTFINSARNKLTGISSDWLGLDNLEYIDLSENSISGLIPASLFYLHSLSHLDLSNNKFSGQITEFKNVTSPLTSPGLSSNKLEGPIPEFFFELHDLLDLSLSSNKFNGTVQLNKFTKLNKLVSLDLSHNSLSVDTNISESDLALLPQLNSFMLASCNLQNISYLKNQSKLSMLDLSNNQLTGEIPNWLVEINDGLLRFLNLSFNQFTHFQEPYTFGFLNFLDLRSNLLTGVIPLPPRAAAYIDFSNNNFATMIPPDFGNYLVTARYLSIANNKVVGSIPSSICNSSYLEVLDLSNNSLNGRIPSCLAEKSNTLKVLNLGKNNLIGNIPEKFSYNCELESLDLSQNHLTGLLPRSLSNCTKLKVLNLGNNKIKDTFPCWLRNISDLRVLVLRFNGFHGNIDCPRVSSNWTAIQIIDLASNNLGGVLPRSSFLELKAMMVDPSLAHSRSDILHFESHIRPIYYQDSVTLSLKGQDVTLTKILLFFTSIDFSSNNFVGNIPETVGDLKSLYLLNISHNNLTGQIPPTFGDLKQLGSLDLSFNKLGGNIPEKLASLTSLSFLNLSYNELVGMIPRGNQLQTFEESSFAGNKGLCGFPLNRTCKNNSGVAPSEPDVEEDKFISRTEIYVSVILGFLVGIGIIFLPLVLSKRWNQSYNKIIHRLILRIFQQQDQDGSSSKSSSVASWKKSAGKSRGSH